MVDKAEDLLPRGHRFKPCEIRNHFSAQLFWIKACHHSMDMPNGPVTLSIMLLL